MVEWVVRKESSRIWNTISWEAENIIIRFDIDHDSLQVHSGPYEAILFFLVNQNTIPLGLIDALGGESLFEIGEEYLQLPIDFKYDTLQISN